MRETLHGHPVAELQPLHPFAQLNHHATGFMASGKGVRGRPVTPIVVQIAAADASALGLEHDITGRGRQSFNLAPVDLADPAVDGGVHRGHELLLVCLPYTAVSALVCQPTGIVAAPSPVADPA